MKALAFGGPGVLVGGRRLRSARFEERSLFPLAAACVVANGVRETLGALLGTPVDVRLFEPLVPTAEAWRRVADGAAWYRVRGEIGEATIVLRADDALALVASAFGEAPPRGRAPSPIERDVLARMLATLAGTLAPLTGRPEGHPVEVPFDPAPRRAYFELGVVGPVALRLGIASAEPPPQVAVPGLRPDALAAAALDLRVRLAAGAIPPVRLRDLRPGAWLPIRNLAAELCAGDASVWKGTPGVQNGRGALRLECAV